METICMAGFSIRLVNCSIKCVEKARRNMDEFIPGPYIVVHRGPDKRKPLEIRAWKTNPNAAQGPLICKMSDVLGRSVAIANADLLSRSWSMLALLEKALPIIEAEADQRDDVPGAPFSHRMGYWT